MTYQSSLFDLPEKSFHNSIHSKGSELIKHESKAKTQEDLVLSYFQRIKRSTALRAAEVLKIHESSCRRAVTNLFKMGKLRKTDEQVLEKYFKQNFIYEII